MLTSMINNKITQLKPTLKQFSQKIKKRIEHIKMLIIAIGSVLIVTFGTAYILIALAAGVFGYVGAFYMASALAVYGTLVVLALLFGS